MPGKNKINKCKNAFENVFFFVESVDRGSGPSKDLGLNLRFWFIFQQVSIKAYLSHMF